MESLYLVYLILILFLILLSGFFSASETAVTAASSARIHKLKTAGNKKAKLVAKLRLDKDSLIGAVLLGNTTANILASAFATTIAVHFLGEQGVIYASVILTLVVLIFAEVLPKTYAFYNAEKVSLLIAPLLYLFVKVTMPITSLVRILVNFLLVIFGIKKHSDNIVSPAEELRGAIDMYHDEGSVIKRERDMLSSILDLQHVEVKDVMVHRKNITSIDIEQNIEDIVRQVLDNRYTRIPVWKEKPENIIGILHVKSLLTALNQHKGDLRAINVLTLIGEPWFVPDTNNIGNQLLQFREKHSHMALVVDEYGDLEGLVTLEDVLEEIVGNIEDEHDTALKYIKPADAKSVYYVHGDATVRDINRELGWDLPERYAVTMAGLLIHELEYIPEEGDEGEILDIGFKVLKKENNQILKLKLKRLKKKGS